MRLANVRLLLALASGCAQAKEPAGLDGAVDGAVADTGVGEVAVGDTSKPSDAGPDVELCDPPTYPPRTDGCPCLENFFAYPCVGAILGKVCDYLGKCPSIKNRYVCTKIPASFQKPERYDWVVNPGGVQPPCPGEDASPGDTAPKPDVSAGG